MLMILPLSFPGCRVAVRPPGTRNPHPTTPTRQIAAQVPRPHPLRARIDNGFGNDIPGARLAPKRSGSPCKSDLSEWYSRHPTPFASSDPLVVVCIPTHIKMGGARIGCLNRSELTWRAAPEIGRFCRDWAKGPSTGDALEGRTLSQCPQWQDARLRHAPRSVRRRAHDPRPSRVPSPYRQAP
jgi:hypothetical protein